MVAREQVRTPRTLQIPTLATQAKNDRRAAKIARRLQAPSSRELKACIDRMDIDKATAQQGIATLTGCCCCCRTAPWIRLSSGVRGPRTRH